MTDTTAAVRAAVGAVTDPELRRSLEELGMVRDVRVDGGVAHVAILLTIVGCPAADRISRDVTDAAASVAGVAEVDLEVGVMSPAQRQALTEQLRGGRAARTMPFGPDSLTRVIAVTSGKGGVGKSTVTTNLAIALAKAGKHVGLMDADIYGPNIPRMMGVDEAPPVKNDKIQPLLAHGVKVISLGFYQNNARGLYLGEEFHHNRVQIICSQIFAVNPALSYRWDVPRLERTIMALQAAGRLELTPLITHEIPFREAERAYQLLDQHPDSAVQAVLLFPEALADLRVLALAA